MANTKRAVVYLHAYKESMLSIGMKLGLTSEALELFKYACSEVEVDIEVDIDTGLATIVALGNVDVQ